MKYLFKILTLLALIACTSLYGQRQRGILEFNSIAELKNTSVQPQDSDFAVVVSPDGITRSLYNFEPLAVADEVDDFALDNFTGTWVLMRGPPSQVGYTIFPVWAEESGGLSNNNTQWSYGNGAVGTIGIPIPEAELFAVGFEADVVGTTVSIEVMQNYTTAVTSQLFTGISGYNELATPIQFNEGDVVGFRTDVESTGAGYTDARAVAWFRIPLLGIKGNKGNKGEDGIPNTVLRTELNTIANINVTGTSFAYNTTPTVNTMGADVVINANNITFQSGTYSIEIMPNYSTVASNIQRPAVGARFLLNGTQYGDDHYNMSYIRHVSGHEVAKDQYKDLFTIATTTTFTATSIQQGIAGTVVLEGGRIIIIKYN